MKTKKNMIITSLVVFVLPAVFAALGWGQKTPYIIDIGSKEGIGSYLVDSKGMTLYILSWDSQGKSTCTGECAVMWRPFYTEKKTVPPGLKGRDLLLITRNDKKRQVTYKGMPLYYFAGDRKPGDTNGYGAYNIWFPATPSGIHVNLEGNGSQ